MCLTTHKSLNAKKSLKIPKGQSEYMYIVDVKQSHTNELDIKDATYRDNSASYLDLHMTIDSEGWIRLQFPHCELFVICSNIQAAPAYRVYISQLI